MLESDHSLDTNKELVAGHSCKTANFLKFSISTICVHDNNSMVMARWLKHTESKG